MSLIASNRSIISTFILLLSVYSIKVICLSNHPLEIVPERAEILYLNEKYAQNGKVTVRRESRKSPYVTNLEADMVQEWNNNISISIIVHEFLHNEYKRSFIEFHFKLCDFVNKDDFIGSRLRVYGIKCPLKGHLQISNGRMLFPVFPYVFPLKRAKAEVIVNVTGTGELVATGNLYMFIKQN